MYQKALVLLRKAWHSHALFWGRDETKESAKRNCVVLAPHPDDESIGMGATIARKTSQGTRVILVVATDGQFSHGPDLIKTEDLIALRKSELRSAAHILGIADSDIYFADEVDTKINDERLKRFFEETVSSLDFTVDEIMSTSWNDSHHDHQACAKIARDFAIEHGLLFRGCPIYWWADGPTRFHRGNDSQVKRFLGRFIDVKRAFLSRGYTVSSDKFATQRSNAIAAHTSQTTKRDGNEDWATLEPRWLATFNRSKEFFINQ